MSLLARSLLSVRGRCGSLFLVLAVAVLATGGVGQIRTPASTVTPLPFHATAAADQAGR